METTTTSPTNLSSPAQTSTLNPTPSTLPPSFLKTITWPMNYNNKMACTGGFIHIDIAPFKKPIRSELERTVIDIYTSDKSHPPVRVRIFDLAFIKLKYMPCAFTLASHGMDEVEFATFMIEKHLEKVDFNTELAVYYYKKVNN